ncbi:MAG TPA: homoserine kinase [Gemmatimonadaceae bacterium]|nr:homoserine kinase [Gemmatimonadaceae bacterium]
MLTLRVPASTSNLGAGFDFIGVAVDKWLSVAVRRAAPGERAPAIRRLGTIEAIGVTAERDLITVGFAAACRAAGREAPSELVLDVRSEIPVSRGLGSSAAAVVAGAVAANVLLQLALDDAAIVDLCSAIEGHPDNVAPAVLGGARLAVRAGGGRFTVAPLDVHESLALVFAVPEFAVETKRARAALPETVTHDTAVVAASRSAALVRGLASAHSALLAAGMNDVLHVPYRRALIAGYDAVTAAAIRAGAFGATLSGSGSTIVAVSPRDAAHRVAGAMAAAWRAIGVAAETFHSAGPVRGYEIIDGGGSSPSTESAEPARDPLSFPRS